MAQFIIEGTVSEIKSKSAGYTFKICGAEGYSIRQKIEKDYVKFNILCQLIESVEDSKEKHQAFLLNEEFEFCLQSECFFVQIIFCAISGNKKVLLEFEEITNEVDGNKTCVIDIDEKKLKLSSITLLAE